MGATGDTEWRADGERSQPPPVLLFGHTHTHKDSHMCCAHIVWAYEKGPSLAVFKVLLKILNKPENQDKDVL